MKISKDYVLRTVADHYIVVPTGQEAVNFNGILTLNKSGKILFEALLNGAEKKELISLLTDKYSVNECDAEKDVDAFIETLKKNSLFE